MLSGKQKRYLRKEAHNHKAILQVGKGGVNENLVKQVNDALEAREIIKISILQNNFDDKDQIASELAKGADAHIVQIIGNTVILYKESSENKQIELPK
jgi:RNA-binding protein